MARLASLKSTDFPRNKRGPVFHTEQVSLKVGTRDRKFAQEVNKRARARYIPVWTGATKRSTVNNPKEIKVTNGTRYVNTSRNWERQDLYGSKGRYAYKNSKGPYGTGKNKNKYEWFNRSYDDLKGSHIKTAGRDLTKG